MKDHKHRNYDYIETVPQKTEIADNLMEEIRYFLKTTRLTHDDFILLNKLLRSLDQKNQSNKVLRGLERKFEAIKQQYER